MNNSAAEELSSDLLHYAADLLLADPRTARLGKGLHYYVDNAAKGAKIEDALGLCIAAGGEGWWITEKRNARDTALCRAAEMIAPDSSTNFAGAELMKSVIRYRRTRWKHDATLKEAPSSYAGRPEAELFIALHAGGGFVPESQPRLRAILSKGRQAACSRNSTFSQSKSAGIVRDKAGARCCAPNETASIEAVSKHKVNDR
jgi:hypothetical protein